MIEKILNSNYLNDKTINKLNIEFNNNQPFEHLSLSNFLDGKFAEHILKSLNKIEYYKEENDLYSFSRTIDFKSIDDKFIEEIRKKFLSEEVISFVESITNVKLNRNKIDLHSLKLTNTDYLLCHDDQVQDRKIAFILNLTKNWSEEYGGLLEFFDSKPVKVIKSIKPEFNQFNLFKVSKKSFHQISEVIGDHKRISISGWYYENK